MTRRNKRDEFNELGAELIRAMFDYDPDDGALLWRFRPTYPRDWNTKYAEKAAGNLDSSGYISIGINGKLWKAHRLAWVHYYGDPAPETVDHINGIRTDNRIANLQPVSSAQNAWKGVFKLPKSGLRGAHASSSRYGKPWYSEIRANGQRIYLGKFDTAEEASAAYFAAKKLHHVFDEERRK